jgi:hypothetical protein
MFLGYRVLQLYCGYNFLLHVMPFPMNNNNNNNKLITSLFLFINAVASIFYNIVIIHLRLCRQLHQITHEISWIEALQNTEVNMAMV